MLKTKTVTQKMRKAFTMLELILVLVVGAILIVGGFMAYNKAYIPTQAEAEAKKAQMIIGGLERAKASYHQGTYPASAVAAIPAVVIDATSGTKLQDALGGASGVNDVASWTYACPAGNASTITIRSEAYTNEEQRRLMALNITNNLSPWVATVTGNFVQITRTNSVCN